VDEARRAGETRTLVPANDEGRENKMRNEGRAAGLRNPSRRKTSVQEQKSAGRETIEFWPSFNELVARVRAVMNTGCDICLHGRYDMGGNRPIYMMLPLGFEDE
jgi:hypothetical protein